MRMAVMLQSSVLLCMLAGALYGVCIAWLKQAPMTRLSKDVGTRGVTS